MDRLSGLLQGAGGTARPLVLMSVLVITQLRRTLRSASEARRRLESGLGAGRAAKPRPAHCHDACACRAALGARPRLPPFLPKTARACDRRSRGTRCRARRRGRRELDLSRPAGWVDPRLRCQRRSRGVGWSLVRSSQLGACGQTARLYDPRLDIGCLDSKGDQIGAAWIEPLRRTRYLAVEHPGYTEIYETAGGLPVRVTTSDVHVEGSSATFSVTQYAADGSWLSHEALRTAVAG